MYLLVPTSTLLPDLAFIISVTISTPVGRKEAGIVNAWEEGRHWLLTLTGPHWPLSQSTTTGMFLETELLCLSLFFLF